MYSRNICALDILRFLVSVIAIIGTIAAANNDDRFTAGMNFSTIAVCWVSEFCISLRVFDLELETDSGRSSSGTWRRSGSSSSSGSSSGRGRRSGCKAAARTRRAACH